jgi:4-hydroxy-3-polyprenylbenzoate decarboxylase
MATITEPRAKYPAVQYTDLRDYMKLLEEKNLVQRITCEVDPVHEMGAIAARSLARKGPAIIFENIKGYPGMPLVTNIISTTQQLAVTFNTEADEEVIHERVVAGMNARIPSRTLATGPCKDVIITGDGIDIDIVPTPVWHELDGGRFLGTTAGIVTCDPHNGALNMGTYRVQIKDKTTLSLVGKIHGFNATTGPGGGDHILENYNKGLPSPVAVVLGMDPLLTLASGSPVGPGPDGSMEYEAAAGWRGAPTELVKCETNDLLVPAHAEMIVEGLIEPGVRTTDGPHGESTGFYGSNKDCFVIKITAITHRRDPVMYGLICQRVEDYPRQIMRSGSIQARIVRKTGLTNIREVYFPEIGRLGGLIVSAKIRDKDDARRIMDGIWNDSGEAWRWLIVVDQDCNVRDWDDIMWRVAATVDPEKHVVLGKVHNVKDRGVGDDFYFAPPVRGMGIDATFAFKDKRVPPLSIVSRELTAQVAARWKEYGLP